MRQETSDQGTARIYLLGNPVVWWAATLAMIYIFVQFGIAIVGKIRKVAVSWDKNYGHFMFIYILNLLPFIGIKRAMFLYHYFPALIFSIIALVYLIDKLPNPTLEKDEDIAPNNNSPFQGQGKKKTAFAVLVAASLAAFIIFAPLTYGLSLTEKAYDWRVWLKSWI